MKDKLFHPATIIALLALFIALSGTSYAISQLPKNSVGNKQLKKNAVTSPKVKDGSLLAQDFKAGQLPQGAQGEPGPQGERGPQGEVGAKGETGERGPTGPSQSMIASNSNTGQALSTRGFSETVLDTADNGNGPLVVSENSRLIVNGSLTLYKGTALPAEVADVQCTPFLFPLGGVGFTIGPSMRATMDLTEGAGGGAGPAGATTIAVSGAVSVVAGSYNVSVMCQRTNTSGATDATAVPIYDSGMLTVIATGR